MTSSSTFLPRSYLTPVEAPALRLPRGSCDAHCHIFGPRDRFRFAETLSAIPADAPKEQLFAVHAILGIDRTVIVQSVTHGSDHAAILDALAARPDACRAVALLPTDIGRDVLRELDGAGFRGARFNFIEGHLHEVEPAEALVGFSRRLGDLGWHLQVQSDGMLIEGLTPVLQQCAGTIVIDHMGRIDTSKGPDQPAFQNLLRLLDDRRFWVKLSGADRISRAGPPYLDSLPFARKLMAEHGDRAVWGLDWPHPGVPTGIPDDSALVDLLADIAPSEEERLALLVRNPEQLYGFAPMVPAATTGSRGGMVKNAE